MYDFTILAAAKFVKAINWKGELWHQNKRESVDIKRG